MKQVEEIREYETSKMAYRDIKNSVDTAKREGIAEGMEIGRAEGKHEAKTESGDVDYEYHHKIKGLYATFSSWHIDPFYFPRKKFFVRKSIKVSFFVAKVRLSN